MKNKQWNKYWDNSKSTLFGRICTLYRYYLITPYLSKIVEKYFPKEGFFVDCGSGSSESSFKLKKHRRKYIALDISPSILKQAKNMKNVDFAVNSDIFKLPFKDNSIEGIWNLGVMEHFDENELQVILNEFYRALKKGAYAIFFWPPDYGASVMFLGAVTFVLNKMFRRNFWYTPEEKTRIKSKKHIRNIIGISRFKIKKLHFSPRDAFTYMVVVCKKE